MSATENGVDKISATAAAAAAAAVGERGGVQNNATTASRMRLIRVLKDAAARAVAEGDPWAEHHIEKIPAERAVRHLFRPDTKTWIQEPTIVKVEKEPFTHGAMRFCFRMKKRSTPPQSATNHRFHSYGWNQASNYVAKAYFVDGEVDTSEEAKDAVRNDIALQYEAAHWAEQFNNQDPPKKIIFIRAYAVEFPDRPGKPWFAVERYISGTDTFGVGFTKHNTNSGFVDEKQHRITPQVFSAFSFYESEGERLVADIQGVSDLYTDPQVLSSDYRFGDGDLGPRGMALFFKTFCHNSLATSMGIPLFALSKNELKHQAKFEDDDSLSISEGGSSLKESTEFTDRFAAIDANRKYRQCILEPPPLAIDSDGLEDTERHSNQSKGGDKDNAVTSIRRSLRESFSMRSKHRPACSIIARGASEIDEVKMCLDLAKQDFCFTNKVFGRKADGAVITAGRGNSNKRSSLIVRRVSEPMLITEKMRQNLGKVHYQLAVLHGLGRFPEIAQQLNPEDDNNNIKDSPPPSSQCAFSVLFHLAHAASMRCVAACLALGRLHAGLGTGVSDCLNMIVPVDFDVAKDLLRRAINSQFPPAAPKAAAGCLLYQIYLDERKSEDDAIGKPSDTTIMQLIEDILKLIGESEDETNELEQHKKRKEGRGERRFQTGDRVEGNYFLEGTYYPGVVDSVSEDGGQISVKYDDDGSIETLTTENVRLIVPPTATQTALGGPLSDEEALGAENSDEKFLVETYDLRAELAELKAKAGDKEMAAALYEEAANEAMSAGKMKKASEWSSKASEALG